MTYTRPSYDNIHSFATGMIYVLYLLKATRILRSLRIRRKLLNIEEEVQRCLADVILRVLIMILFSKFVYLLSHLL